MLSLKPPLVKHLHGKPAGRREVESPRAMHVLKLAGAPAQAEAELRTIHGGMGGREPPASA